VLRPAEASAVPKPGRVLLVGNGPSVRACGLGTTIDKFDAVVRFNSFVTCGLEEHTGRRTSLWCHMLQWFSGGGAEGQVAERAVAGLPSCYAWNHVVLAPLIFVPGYLMPMFPSPGSMTWSVATYWRAHRLLKLRPHQVPTTGFVMLLKLLEAVPKVHLLGFDGYGGPEHSELHYYAEEGRQVRANVAGAMLHDWGKEKAAIHALLAEGRVALLRGRDDEP